jgi:O-antigen/teichoic acid export membrane protein
LNVQAEFGLIANLISIVCRFVFQPIEEIAFNLFSKYNKADPEKKGMTPLYILAKISQFLSLIGLGMITFGTLFARMFLRIVYTEKWATDSAC